MEIFTSTQTILLHATMAMTLNPWNLNLIQKEEVIVVFFCPENGLFLQSFILLLISRNTLVIFTVKPRMINSFKKQKHWFLLHTWLDTAFKGAVIYRALSSVHGGSFEITRAVDLFKPSVVGWEKTKLGVGSITLAFEFYLFVIFSFIHSFILFQS